MKEPRIKYHTIGYGKHGYTFHPNEEVMSNELIINHNAGMFSCSTIALQEIMIYYNHYQRLPDKVHRSEQYLNYKHKPYDNLIPMLFAETDDHWEFTDRVDITLEAVEQQYSNYKMLRFGDMQPFLDKYFRPSETILNRISELESKYNIDYENTIGVFYRGNDKNRETTLPTHGEFIKQTREVMEHSDKILLLPDEIECWGKYNAYFDAQVYPISETPMIPKQDSSVFYELPLERRPEHAINFLALTIMLSKCKKLILHSGNCSFWCALYRGNMNNVWQWINGEWR